MPVARNEAHAIRAGLQTVASFNSTHEVQNFPVQSDQFPIEWAIDSELCIPPRPARVTTNADLSRSPDGFLSGVLGMSYVTNGMFSYMLTSFLPSGVDSADATIRVYTDADVEIYLQCLLYRPRPNEDMQWREGGWEQIIWRYERGIVIT